jgi:DNA polymerase-3 subunit epsilon
LNEAEARLYLEELCEKYQLCAKYCHLQEGVNTCSHFRVPKCQGICRGTEAAATYNLRVKEALTASQPKFGDHVIFQEGRTSDERGLIWISDGRCKGFGFVPGNFFPENILELSSAIPSQISYPESDRLLESFVSKHPEHLIEINM